MDKNKLVNKLTGKIFGKLTVLKRAEQNSKSGNAMWVCQCSCGNIVSVIGSHLRSHHTTSCGCNRVKPNTNGHSKERLYHIWRGMNNRCFNHKDHRYKWYGEKGITICNEWIDFLTFREWALNNGYSDDLTIDRIDKYGNYSPQNCQWVNMKVQANNRNNNRIIQFNGKKYTATQLAEAFNLSPYTIFNRLKLGWEIERIVSTPERLVADG